MTIREFFHDMRDRFTDDRHSRRDWRDDDRSWDREGYERWDERSDRERRQMRDWDVGRNERPRSAPTWSGQRFMDNRQGLTRGSYDPGVFRGGTWNAWDEWTMRPVDDYAQPVTRYTALGWPDHYATTLFGVSFRGRGPQNWRRADARIREDVCELMTEDPDLDPSDVEVRVENGEVTLTGTVESRRDKRLAEDLAERVNGVRDVHNRLQVQRARDTFLGTREALAGSSPGASELR